jgi:hypothetical protein
MIQEARKDEKDTGGMLFFNSATLTDDLISKVFESVKTREEGHINFIEFKNLCEKLGIIDSPTVKTQQLMHILLSQWIGSVEVEDPVLIFSSVWRRLVGKYGTEDVMFPKEFLLLGGAPGAGKGTCSPFITRARGYTSDPIVMSDLLNSPQAKRIKV